jgi:hypothetical protein
LFKPVYLGGGGLPYLGPEPTGSYDPESLWWRHERLHRAVIRDYPTRIPLFEEERDALETAFLSEAGEMREASGEEAGPDGLADAFHDSHLAEFTASCFRRADEATERWTRLVSEAPIEHSPLMLFTVAWNRFNGQADFAR